MGSNSDAFVSDLIAAGYNTENAATGGDPGWGAGVLSVVPSVQSRLSEWRGGAPSCGGH